ncbi:HNH endonuclease [Micromonospora sp. DPT]|uniref:HNH endonuclease n=1 Tax=Micromonospora sp. DPT TaxID=3142975 RepID=UPI0032095204
MNTISRACSVVECDRLPVARGWCLPHYKRWRRRGTTHDITPEQRFFTNVIEADNGCWLWAASKTAAGYGKFTANGACVSAHRWAYQLLIAEIPVGLSLDHLCRNPSCVNPWHLDPVTDRVNVVVRGRGLTAENARKTHCKHGHEFTRANTYITPRGTRNCRACRAAAHHRSKKPT